PECVDTTTECVDTLSHLSRKGLLDAGSSVDTPTDCVDTTTDCVDTLSQSDKWISWNLGLKSPPVTPTSTPHTVRLHYSKEYNSHRSTMTPNTLEHDDSKPFEYNDSKKTQEIGMTTYSTNHL
ncbi:hypothetical protein Taro_049272, partial [Colocasia esculenta]|nr:hypothetical protein [Colocasia esculenta]